MENYRNYTRNYFPPPNPAHRWAAKDYVDHPPIWCSVDLRDGNQALITPMSLSEKLRFFELLVEIGFKEIEVGFPAASETEYAFLRTLIEKDMIPDDVTVQVLTQAREHIIAKTFEALKGAKRAIVHVYNSTSLAQREQVFQMSRDQIIRIAVDGAALLQKLAAKAEGEILYEYSPESFTGTEMDFALEICDAVLDVWKPTPEKKTIINLPNTVQMSMSHVYADQVEFMCDHISRRDSVILSIHPHNDRGCAVADCEMGILAGAERVEGTLFGNGERTGNADLVTVAMNMYAQGVDPGLDFSNLPKITDIYEETTRMDVYDRQPYSGKLVFAAFSGSHQDAIAKGMRWRQEHRCQHWTVPYLPIDPRDIGREYETDVIRINSQSGKGGIGYLMEQKFGYHMPKLLREDFGYCVKGISDRRHRELLPEQIHNIFKERYVNVGDPIEMVDYHFTRREDDVTIVLTIKEGGRQRDIVGHGNGRLDAASNALKEAFGLSYQIATYQEHALTEGSGAEAVSYVCISLEDGRSSWGAGIHSDIIASSIKALISAINRGSRLGK